MSKFFWLFRFSLICFVKNHFILWKVVKFSLNDIMVIITTTKLNYTRWYECSHMVINPLWKVKAINLPFFKFVNWLQRMKTIKLCRSKSGNTKPTNAYWKISLGHTFTPNGITQVFKTNRRIPSNLTIMWELREFGSDQMKLDNVVLKLTDKEYQNKCVCVCERNLIMWYVSVANFWK